MSSCEECGYDYDVLGREQIVGALPELAGSLGALLSSMPFGELRAHTRPDSWSALEYGCHVRDLLRVQRDRVLLAQVEEVPTFVSMRRDQRAIEERYNEQDPGAVAAVVIAGAQELAETLAGLRVDGWLRTGIYPWPTPEARTVKWIGRRAVHELAHHLFDCHRLLDPPA